MQGVLLVLDGLGDREVNGKTPLEVADTPNMDELAKEGVTGLYYSVGVGVKPGSTAAMLGILGYDPIKENPGRGVAIAVGLGVYEEGALAARANLATVKNGKIVDRRAGRIKDKKLLKKIEKVLNSIEIPGLEIKYVHTLEHRGVVVARPKHGPLSANIITNDPEHGGSGLWLVPASKEAEHITSLLNSWLKECKKELEKIKENAKRTFPANFLILRGFGASVKKLTPFKDKYGVNAAVVTGQDYLKGIARLAGIDIVEISEESVEKNVKGIVNAVKKDKEHDLLIMHVKATDIPGHDGDFEGKVRALEFLDKNLVGRIMDEDKVIAITGDHATPVSLKKHSGDPCPLLVSGGGIVKDKVSKFSERECMKGGLGVLKRDELLRFVLSAMDRPLKVGT